MTKTDILNTLKVIILATLVTFGANYLYAAWSSPSADPTGGNPEPPVNVGPNVQVKSGSIGASAFSAPTFCLSGDCRSSWPSAGGSAPSGGRNGGSVELGNGLVMNWGREYVNGNGWSGVKTVALPTPYTTYGQVACSATLSVREGRSGDRGGIVECEQATGQRKTHISLQVAGTDTSEYVNWISVGY